MNKWTGRYYTNKKTSEKIRKKLKKYYKKHDMWNKGKITSKIIKKYGSHKNWIKHKRKSRKYYLTDLKANAIRRFKRDYDKKRWKQIRTLLQKRKNECGYPPRRRWHNSGVKY